MTSSRRGPGSLLLALALLAGGCASVQRNVALAQQRSALLETGQHVYPLPPEQVWPQVEAWFREQGFTLHTQRSTEAGVRSLQTDFREATLGPGFAARYRQALQRYGPGRFFVLPMAPERFPRDFDGYFHVRQLSASPPAHPELAGQHAPKRPEDP